MVPVRLGGYWVVATALLASGAALFYWLNPHPGGRVGPSNPAEWQRMASPGPLSRAHAFLEHDCAACHTAVVGAERSKCVVCHANAEVLLSTQRTAFHAHVVTCRTCHLEHEGSDRPASGFEHAALIRAIEMPEGEATLVEAAYSHLSKDERALHCGGCHDNEDPHRTLFGTDCASCHLTVSWTIDAFRHPSPTSRDCAQCHQAPPSHYMEHFKMVSMRVVAADRATVTQCFLCHRTSSWNDIAGVGWYKHH